MKITAVLLMNEIEPSLRFWVERIGFEKTVEVPEGNQLAFAIMVKDGAELMLQTLESAAKDVPTSTPVSEGQSVGLFHRGAGFRRSVEAGGRVGSGNGGTEDLLWDARDRGAGAGRIRGVFRQPGELDAFDAHDHLAGVGALEHGDEGLRGVLEAVDDLFAVF